MSDVIVEIRAAEGGDDAKSLVVEQTAVYQRRAKVLGVGLALVESLPAMTTLIASGPRAAAMFADEQGGHRWQRVPPNEKRGRVHTSTVTVAVLPAATAAQVSLNANDVEATYSRGSGPGGQHRNKTESCVVLRHRPTGVVARCDATPSQAQNRETAMRVLAARISAARIETERMRANTERRQQVGTGMRGDKRRTIRTQDGVVTDHVTGRRWRLRDYLRGEW